HFAGRIKYWELWNEPNLSQFFEGSIQEYIDRVLMPGADAIRAACATCVIVGPGLASIGDVYDDWLNAILLQAANKIDIVNGHIYAAFPADDSGAGLTKDSFWNKLEAHRQI